MERERFMVLVPPHLLGQLRGRPVTACHQAYCVGTGPHLLACGLPAALRGGFMAVSGAPPGKGERLPFCREVAGECRARRFSGVVLDLEGETSPFFERLLPELEEQLYAAGVELCVPEEYGALTRRAGVMISSALSGGSLKLRLEEAVQRFGHGRVVLALQRACEDFTLPAPDGQGRTLPQEELEQRRREREPAVYFSPELCARYFTYADGEGRPHFVLFDDGATLCRKMETARAVGIGSFLAAWPEIEGDADRIGLARRRSR